MSDPRYLRRRRAFAALARGHQVGEASPIVQYTEDEHATWRKVHSILAQAHRRHACREVLEAREHAPIPLDRIPQHEEVGAELKRRTGFTFTLAGGVVPNKRFLGSMARGYFHAVQFVRHPAVPLYTPEPDVIHDIFGHGIHLTSPAIADIYRLSGQAAARVNSPEALEVISHVYWFTLECGLVAEHGVPKAFGAALLSSYGEIGRSVRQIRELDVSDVMRTGYEISEYQPVLFCAHSLGHMTDTLGGFLETLDDDAVPRPCREAGQASSGNSAGPGWRSRRFTYPPPIKETLPSA